MRIPEDWASRLCFAGDWPEAQPASAAARLAAKPQAPAASSASDHSEQASLQGLDGGAEEVSLST